MFGPLLPLNMLQREYFFSVYLKGAPQAVFVSLSEMNLARKEYIVPKRLKDAIQMISYHKFLEHGFITTKFEMPKAYLCQLKLPPTPVTIHSHRAASQVPVLEAF